MAPLVRLYPEPIAPGQDECGYAPTHVSMAEQLFPPGVRVLSPVSARVLPLNEDFRSKDTYYRRVYGSKWYRDS
jgi:hypothetical protein